MFVSPFIGWKENNGEDTYAYMEQLTNIYRVKQYKTEIIGAAVRSGKTIAELAELDVDIVTCSLEVLENSFAHPYTTFGLKTFTEAWDYTKDN